MDTCLVSGEKLGGMGKPFEYVHQGQQIKFCCKNCLPDFEKDSAKYLAKLK
jgi:YHS domain-containing protein